MDPRGIDWLEQIVEGLRFEGLYGKVVVRGDIEKIKRTKGSTTGKYLRGDEEIPVPAKRRPVKGRPVKR